MPATKRLAAQRSEDLALVEAAARGAGAEAMRYFGKEPRSWLKDADSPVSEADLAVDAIVRDLLLSARPGHGWLSEESPAAPARAANRATWIVDPIDGTRAFLKGRADWTISIALVENGRPVVAAVYNPPADRLFSAQAGGGAFLDGRRIDATRQARIEGARMLAYDASLQGRRWRRPWPRMEVHRVNSIAYRLCLVAAGEYDATLSSSPKSDWDIAAGDLIMQEAGAALTGFNGAAFVYNRADFRHPNVVGAGMPLHGHLLSHIADAYRG